jgi:hypothetical protein
VIVSERITVPGAAISSDAAASRPAGACTNRVIDPMTCADGSPPSFSIRV